MRIVITSEILRKLSELFNQFSCNLEPFYEELASNFEKDYTVASQGFIEVDKPKLSNDFTALERERWTFATLTGFDLPVLLKPAQSFDKTILILGIDPLRKRRDFPGASQDKLIIGTPYAIHSNFYRNRKNRTRVYWDFFAHVLKQYNVYLTDAFKIWMNISDQIENVKYQLEFSHLWVDLLRTEINSIKPYRIITFGSLANSLCKSAIDKSQMDIIIELPHPSGRNQNWNSIIAGPKSVDAKYNYLCKKFDEKVAHFIPGNISP